MKSGTYGKFYGSVDPMAITCSLLDFMRERQQKLNEYANEDYMRR